MTDLSQLSNDELVALYKKRQQSAQEPYRGSILPMSKDAQGNVQFDSNAGILGMIRGAAKSAWGAATLPGDVYTGKVAPLSEEAIGRSADLASIANPVNPAVRAGDFAIAGVAKNLTKEVPTARDLKAAGAGQIQAAKAAGVDFKMAPVKQWAGEQAVALQKSGFTPANAPGVFAELNRIAGAPDSAFVQFGDLISFRQALQRHAQNFNEPTNGAAASDLVGALDQFLSSPNQTAVLAGNAEDAAKLYAEGRGNYAAGKRSDLLSSKEYNAEMRAAAANSGRNIGNTKRQRIVDILAQDPAKRSIASKSGFNDTEVSALEDIVKGSRAENISRDIGNRLAGGGGTGSFVLGAGTGGGIGAATGDPVLGALIGAGVVGTGHGARALSNALSGNALKRADELVRTRSPLFDQARATVPGNPEAKAALLRALMGIREDQ